jgi:predicted dehydrogenase
VSAAPVRAALIGAGRIGMRLEGDPKRRKPATHFGMWLAHPEAELVAVCDRDGERLAEAQRLAPGVITYDDPATLLERERPDVVSIATWKDSHYEMLKLTMDAGVRVIVCEKPIAERAEHAREVVAEARKRGVELLINHRRRFDPVLYPFRDELTHGLVGELLQVSSYYVYGLLTTGTHLVDALRFLLCDAAGEIEWVSGFPNRRPHFAPPDDPCVDAVLGFASGLKATMQSVDMKSYDLFDIEIFGSRGRAALRNIGRDLEITPVRASPEHEGFTELEPEPSERRGGEPRDQFGMLADNAIACLRGTATSLSTGEDSLRALEILLAIRESARDGGRPVELAAPTCALHSSA